MPRNPTTGVFTRVSNSFSDPIAGTIIDPTDADELFDDYDAGLTNSLPTEPEVETASPVTITAGTATVAIQRVSPTATAVTLPSVDDQDGIPIHIVDWSTSVTEHTITITPAGGETIMREATWQIVSNSIQLASVTLYPSTTLNGYYISP